MRTQILRAVAALLMALGFGFMFASAGGFEPSAWVLGAFSGSAMGAGQYLLLGEAMKRRGKRCASRG
jgi:hypothetical protein